MTSEEVELVRESWRRLGPEGERASQLFYDRLFELHPESRQLFAGTDLPAQGRKLMDMIGGIVGSLDAPLEAIPEVAALGRRHVSYGVQDRDYASVGAALLWTLEQLLGDSFTPELHDAWAEAYLRAAAIMRRAAARAPGGEG